VAYTLAIADHGAVMQLKLPILLACAAGACLLAGCGQTGSLYLPDEGVTTPVEIRPAPTTVPTAAPSQAPAEEKQDDSTVEGKPPAQG
jgi:predicted small lipoprotein YifL